MNGSRRIRVLSWLGTAALLCGLGASPVLLAGNVLRNADRQAEVAQPLVYRPETPFDPQQAAQAMAPGTATIRGVVFHRLDRFGNYVLLPPNPVRTMEGIDVFLYPATPHMVEFMKLLDKHVYRKLKMPIVPQNRRPKQVFFDDAALDYRKVVKSDQYGRYTFTDLKPGRYIVYSAAYVTSNFNVSVPVGSSEISYGIYGTDNVTHYGLEERTRRTDIEYRNYIDIKSDGQVVEVESLFKPVY
jgi:hypothetical protein